MTLYNHNISFPYKIYVSAKIPYCAELSKNRKEIYTKKFTRKKIKNPIHEQSKRIVYLKFASLTRSIQFVPRSPVLVVVTVCSTKRSCDAHNFAEGICDALEDAIKVNDRYFQVYTIPMINKDDPHIKIEVLQ